jgi:flagellar biogenesis protein FliO
LPGDLAALGPALGSLAVILGAVFVCGACARRLRRSGWTRRTGPSPITVIAARSLGGQNSLLIVEADGHRFLVGAGREGLSAIGRLGDRDG